ncbi:hypothetical protein [Chlamydia sp. 17-3921]|uniref:hypothetical protein n=1 Tax=Chlamydia sp. 17-3921 TaxID=2675798 RepID=UPI001918652F|nr:hypothetical protein [Chlamydia sp. 17-3921]
MSHYTARRQSFDTDTIYTYSKVSGTVIGLMLLPVSSIISGVIGIIFLIIKTLYKLITYLIDWMSKTSETQLMPLSKRFTCILEARSKPLLAPLLLCPVIGTAIYLTIVSQIVIKECCASSCFEITAIVASCPLLLFLDSILGWKNIPGSHTLF